MNSFLPAMEKTIFRSLSNSSSSSHISPMATSGNWMDQTQPIIMTQL